MTISILVVTGASGVGKTATVDALDARGLPGVECFRLDSIGVPTPEAMERDYGGGEQWQKRATEHWVARLAALGDGARVAVLDAQTRPLSGISAQVRTVRARHHAQEVQTAVRADDRDAAYADRLGSLRAELALTHGRAQRERASVDTREGP